MANETLGGMFRIFAGRSGTFTLNGVTPVAVTNRNITANSVIILSVKTPGGTVSATAPNPVSMTPGVGFSVAGLAADTSVYNYTIIR